MAVCSDIFLFIMCLLDTGGLVFILIYFIIILSDLECDYLNAQECCAKLNFVSLISKSVYTIIHIYYSKSIMTIINSYFSGMFLSYGANYL